MHIEPVTLRGTAVSLEPMLISHADALAEVGLAPELWRWIPSRMQSRDDMLAWVRAGLDDQARGVALPFVIVDQGSSRVIGATRFANIERAHRRLEIGWTWITPMFQRGPTNTEAKRLLLAHAFETLGAHRVEFKTDALNAPSRRAIARIGATEEGTFRKHMVTDSGRVRDTVYFSILDTEWPAVKARLQARATACADALPASWPDPPTTPRAPH